MKSLQGWPLLFPRPFYIRRRFGKIGVVGRQQPHPRAAAVRLDGKVRLSVVCRLVPGGSGDMSALVLLGSFFSNGLFPEEGFLYPYLDPIFLETPWKENISPARWGAVAECTTMLAPQIWGLLATAAPDCTLAALGHPIHGHPPKNFQWHDFPRDGKDSSATQLKQKWKIDGSQIPRRKSVCIRLS